MNLITGYKGKEHIRSIDIAYFNATVIGIDEVVLEVGEQLSYEIKNNTLLRIFDGDLLMQGRHIRIDKGTYEDVDIDVGTINFKRIDLLVVEYSKDVNTGVETSGFKVIKGITENTIPNYIHSNMLEEVDINQFPLYKITINGLNIESVEKLFSTVKSTWSSLNELALNKLDKSAKAADSIKFDGKASSEFASSNHNHDASYYTKSEIDGLLLAINTELNKKSEAVFTLDGTSLNIMD